MEPFKLKGENIKLGQFLKIVLDFSSGGYAKIFLEEQQVFVNDEIENRRNKRLKKGDIVTINEKSFIID